MANKVKIIGYAKKDFFTTGIEYRNFSPDLVGLQLTSDGGTPLFTSANFAVTTNLDGKSSKNFITNDFGDFITLDTLEDSNVLTNTFYQDNFKLKLNLDKTDVLNYAFFGSLKEYIRVSLENIIIKWPASIKVTSFNVTNPILTGLTVTNYIYDSTTNQSTFNVSTDRLNNPFNVNFLSNGTIVDTFNETNDLRNLSLNYASYDISNKYGDFPVVSFVGASASTTTLLSFTVIGNPFENIGTENISYHIKPNVTKVEQFFISLNNFENNLLNRQTIPLYTGEFKTFNEMDSGAMVEVYKKITWPASDGYNIDFNTIDYELYVNQLIDLAEINDNSKSNLMTRFLVSKSISEFDSVPDVNGVCAATNGEKMTSALKIYGREFDEIKKYSDGISFANVVTYNKKNNTPDATLKNLARVLGWDLTSSLTDTSIVNDYLIPKNSTYSGTSKGMTNIEAEIELWRRLILNTPWIWKSKGTRKVIEFLFKFIGAPDGLITFNEHIHVADKTVDVDRVKFLMDFFNNTQDISTLNVDSDGYPRTLPNTSSMYFQKGGLWYRTTGGENPDIDILHGNNPHIGPYDNGEEFVVQFTDCLVPNFIDTRIVDLRYNSTTDNLFTNYNNGSFNECCEGTIEATLDTNYDFQGALDSNVTNFINANDVDESGCTITSDWSIRVTLGGVVIQPKTSFFSGTTTPTSSDYINELNVISGLAELSGLTTTTSGTDYIFSEDYSDCVSDVLGKYLKMDLYVDTGFVCTGATGNVNSIGDIMNNVPFEQAGLASNFASSITITDDSGLDVSNCFNIITNIGTLDGSVITSGDTCETLLEIRIGEPIETEIECLYTGVDQQADGLILLTYGDGSTSLNVHPECCQSLGYVSEIGVNSYYVCRWNEAIDVDDCNNYISTGAFDENEYMIYEFVTGGTTTIVPSAECCYNNGYIEVSIPSGGFNCIEEVIEGCGVLIPDPTPPLFGDIEFFNPVTNSSTTVVEFSNCCTLNGWNFRTVNGGFTCFIDLLATLPTVFINTPECCGDKNIISPT